MEYERIHKPQAGMISPSKLRMKLVEFHNQIKKAGCSNRSSTRTSPSRMDDDARFLSNSLLQDSQFHDQGSSLQDSVANAKCSDVVDQPKDFLASDKVEQIERGDSESVGSMYPLRLVEEDNLDYDSNASSSSFEFQKAERAAAHSHATRASSRPMSSKWNDAEKWIMNRKTMQGSHAVKRQIQASIMPGVNMGRVVPEASSNDNLLLNKFAETKRVDFCLPEHAKGLGLEKFSFVAPENDCGSFVPNPAALIRNMKEFNHHSVEDASGLGIRAVCMRDMGTEMTPIASQDPSRTSTPLEATTPLRSPSPSLPSTPRREDPTSTPADCIPVGDAHKELSEEELKLKTRREIVALGVQLGKVNIAAWASKEDRKKHNTPVKNVKSKEMEKLEYEKRAAAWEEVENTKHSARLKREEIQIQAWESREKAKLEAAMRRTEAQIEQMRAQAQAKMLKKISKTKQRAEAHRIKAETQKYRLAEKAASQAEYIRQTGRLPSSSSLSCCGF